MKEIDWVSASDGIEPTFGIPLLLVVEVKGAQQEYWYAVGIANKNISGFYFSCMIPGLYDENIQNVTHWKTLPELPIDQVYQDNHEQF